MEPHTDLTPIPRSIETPAIGVRFTVGEAYFTVEAIEPGSPNDWTGRTIVTGVDSHGEPVELRFIPDKEWEDDA